MSKPLIIGLGNRWRGDDGIGPLVLDALQAQNPEAVDLLENPADTLNLINAWAGRKRVYLIDACCDPQREDGSLVIIANALEDTTILHTLTRPTSSHIVDIAQAIRLSQALGQAPQQLTIYAVVTSQFEPGTRPRAVVAAAVSHVVEALRPAVTANAS
ncbi:hydrogenase maturation protease [Aestuariicella hydrocarbonica]|uniref:Hydrogenase maturation protease n=1 Tax=Pseudomaricurvus hydrocarbonicus TaxID=1470433 RepID=A0A9E5MN79_9GAMM|nr:hydrogenase maturation protease [Aestuariicella hydrocarbonica]NHO67302.1 hydrogenase maturation protease [Aestuariicella hydrocarbonica]